MRLDDLQPGYAFGQLDRSIIMNPNQVNSRIVLPVTTYEHVMKGYRANRLTQIETLVHMVFFERSHAVLTRNLEAQTPEPVLKSLLGRIANDEERHEEFFGNLVGYLLAGDKREEPIAAIASRAAALDVVGGDIDAYADKRAVVAEAGIFDDAAKRAVIADRIAAWGVADEPVLKEFIGA